MEELVEQAKAGNSEDKRWSDTSAKLIYNRYDKLLEHYGSFDKVYWFHEIVAASNDLAVTMPIVEYK